MLNSRSWKDYGKETMLGYTERTDGSKIEEKESSLFWNFGAANRDFGEMQAKEMATQLQIVLEFFPVDIILGHNGVEVRPRGNSKGELLNKVIKELSQKRDIDFALCIGDDDSDEPMFKCLNNTFKKRYSTSSSTKVKFFPKIIHI
jgi:trehalose 6-phosphate synthase/phosphatase